MKQTILQYLTFSTVAAAVALAGASVHAQGHQQVLDGQVIGGSVHPIDSGSYVGDMPIESGPVVSGGHVVGGGVADGGVVSDGVVGGCMNGDCGAGGGGGGAGFGRSYGQPDLFYNYYTQGYSNQTNAQMYLSPLPVPPNVGHTFFTYQPFYPHEMLYWHKNRFHRYYDNGRGMNRTRATYYSPPIHTAVQNLYWNYLRLPR